MDSDYAELVADLMRRPLAGFIAARAEAVRGLRAGGNREVAERIAALRKPSVAMWALNQAGQVVADDLDALRTAGTQLRDAQEELLKGDRSAAQRMSAAARAQRQATDTISRRLGMVLTSAGHGASDETVRHIGDVLNRASVADGETWTALRDGWLLSDPEPPTLPAVDVTAVKAAADVLADHESSARRNRLAAAEAEVRRAEEFERTAREHEDAARQRREEASDALREAHRALAALQAEGADS